ncbi:glycoside hydrolase [Lentinula aff. detonsa]|uniref:Alpha-galactosidase n=1 Tax=Lentinula aff. detonsa TaxID=2804958 RepID=A0AA38KNP9_9AGAR|nr:glycoside hydrolase [Lentinula aff. detonsa]
MHFPALQASLALAQTAPDYGQCGGLGWTGATTCESGWSCVVSNLYYSQCVPGSSGSSGTSTSTSTASTPSLTGIAATAPTTPPSKLTGMLPALGWNHWNAYGCSINETKVVAAANDFISLGLKDAGYEYINIDDCWPLMERNATTQQIVPDPSKFPNGIVGVATQVHALGLKMGIYSDAGTATCAGFPGSLGMESLDAATFSSWGVDYLKYDNCNVPANWTDDYAPQDGDWYNSNSAIRYRQMGAALAEQSSPFQFDLCIWGAANVWDWGARVGHSWRMSGDSAPTWQYITEIIGINVQYLSSIDFFSHNDMDMMEIGNGALTIEEQRTHFAAWVFLKSPILLGTDLSLLNSTQISIVTNTELLAFSQDATIGTPAAPFNATASMPTTSIPEYYSGKSSKGVHVFVINTSATSATKSFAFANVPGLTGSGPFVLHDMWAGTDLAGTYSLSSTFSVNVASHDTVAYRITSA